MTKQANQTRKNALLLILGVATAICAYLRLKDRQSLLMSRTSRPDSVPDDILPQRQNSSIRSLLIGALIAILAGIIGGWAQGYSWYHYELKRAASQRQEEVVRNALEWAASGRHYSFRGMDLGGANLAGVDLGSPEEGQPSADLSYSNLSNANFCMASLKRADLSNADVANADFLGADLFGATLYSLNTEGSRFIDCDFRNARVSSRFQNVDFADSRFHNADATWSAFVECNLAACDFGGADLSQVDFTGSRIVQANLSNTNLAYSVLAETDLSGANLEGSILTNCDLRGAILDDVNLSGIVYSPFTAWPEGFAVPSNTVKVDGRGFITYTVARGERRWYVEPITASQPYDVLTPEELLAIIDEASQDDVLSKIPGHNEALQGIREAILEEIANR